MSTYASAEAFAPASMGNVGVGFDILGMAFDEPGDVVVAERRDEPGIVIHAIEGDGGQLPLEAMKNTAGVAAYHVLKRHNADWGLALTIKKGLPLASGLGSSAASAVAAAVAANALLDEPLPHDLLLACCLEGEAIVSGYHADNVGPSLFGGITLITGTEAAHIRQLPVPTEMRIALVTPDVEVPTAEARAVLPQNVPLKAMVAQTGAVARLIDALYRDDLEAVAAAMEHDQVIEPARAHLMPMLREARTAAHRAGALGLVISGAGPTLCAVCGSDEVAAAVAESLRHLYENVAMTAMARTTCANTTGARVLRVD